MELSDILEIFELENIKELRPVTSLVFPGGPGGFPTWNDYITLCHANKHAGAALKAKWRSESFLKAEDWIIAERGYIQPLLERALVVVRCFFPENRGQDTHNAWIKPALDGMELAGLFGNDKGVCVYLPPVAGYSKTNPRYEYHVYEIVTAKVIAEDFSNGKNKKRSGSGSGGDTGGTKTAIQSPTIKPGAKPEPGPEWVLWQLEHGNEKSPRIKALQFAWDYAREQRERRLSGTWSEKFSQRNKGGTSRTTRAEETLHNKSSKASRKARPGGAPKKLSTRASGDSSTPGGASGMAKRSSSSRNGPKPEPGGSASGSGTSPKRGGKGSSGSKRSGASGLGAA